MMWDFGNNDQNRPRSSKRSPSPAFPSPQYANATYAPTNYPTNSSYMPMPMPMPNISSSSPTYQAPSPQYYYPQQPSPGTEVLPRATSPYQVAPQVIIIKRSHHRKHRDGRHRSHSNSHSQPQSHSHSHSHLHSHSPQAPVIPQISHSYSDTAAYLTVPPTINYPQPQRGISYHPSNASIGHHTQPVIPQIRHSHSAAPVLATGTHKLHKQRSFFCSSCTGRKKALCIGINYTGQERALRGCINDANNVRRWLIKYHGFKSEDIVLLTDDTSNRRHLPTRQNLIDAMKWLVRSAKPHDSLFFHYSGHGGQIEDQDGDEADGFDEVIFPLDYKDKGMIVDDELHDIMVSPLPTGCRLTALFDSCHSGTVLDLPYIYSCEGREKKGTYNSTMAKEEAKQRGCDFLVGLPRRSDQR
ncbi:hypothetical protein NP233_g11913 [Leucocoprinus birnbaumii]|uniref:Peptidase C14 caspase domain-containing protein n=1 Tax=Leucocoprinus birnbaumii TaxID=56174 RepID=A0AAD5VI29_9AGAR|nr:hypothetical protein NP233_g11913 [Leucocoprinus birnbaumii]